MSCPHAESTAILYLFGEAPADYAAHLEGCEICQNTILAHQETLAVVTPHIPAQARRRPVRVLAPIAAIIAIAAAVLLTVRMDPPSLTTPTLNADVSVEPFFEAENDSALLALEIELALMNLEDN
jgi:hypothetical protein